MIKETDIDDERKGKQAAINKPNKVRKFTNYLLLTVGVLLIFSIISDRIIPTTDNARVKGYVVPINPQVSGQVLDILFRPNQPVKEGDVLAQLNPADCGDIRKEYL
jgi:multidrug resistance efflux pump